MRIILYLLVVSSGLVYNVSCDYKHTGWDYIECYQCTSQDVSCGERVTDTMVNTVKCPKTHKCTVFTNSTDKIYIQRGCSDLLDFNETGSVNGCHEDKQGFTYCLCDFSRCNANGISHLKSMKTIEKITKNQKPQLKVLPLSPERVSKLVRRSSVSYITKLIPTVPVVDKNKTIDITVGNETSSLSESEKNSTSSLVELFKEIPKRIYQSYVARHAKARLGKYLISNETDRTPVADTTELSLNKTPKLKMKSLDDADQSVEINDESVQINSTLSDILDRNMENSMRLKENYEESITESTRTTPTTLINKSLNNQEETSSKYLNKITVEYYPELERQTKQPETEIEEIEEDLDSEKKRTTLLYQNEAVLKRVDIIRKIEKLLDSMDFDEFLSLLEARNIIDRPTDSLTNTTTSSRIDNYLTKQSYYNQEYDDLEASTVSPYETSITVTPAMTTDVTELLDLTISNTYETIPIKKSVTSTETTPSTTSTTATSTTATSTTDLTTTNKIETTLSDLYNIQEPTPIIKSILSNEEPMKKTLDNELKDDEYSDLMVEMIKTSKTPDTSEGTTETVINTTELPEFQVPPIKSTAQPTTKKTTNTTTKATTTSSSVYTSFEFLSTITGMGLGLVPISSTDAIIAPNKQRDPKTVSPYNWYHIFSDEYKKELAIDYKCKANGLFSHPTVCWKFIQCIYFNTVHERFLVSNCPADLYFNEERGYCDHRVNVKCPSINQIINSNSLPNRLISTN